jgi:3',5'-cyclic AMP phosphodiesterase CpdA
VRIVQLSDIHVWRYSVNPLRLLNKRAIGVVSLLAGRARRFRLERLAAVVERIKSLEADHILITGDLTTTALPDEFADARAALAPLLDDPARVTIVPGNHDRYTSGSVRHQSYEKVFGEFMPKLTFPWLRPIDGQTAILGLDATRSHLSATGRLPLNQLDDARSLVADPATRPRRLIIANHYPVVAPPVYAEELSRKRMKNADEVRAWLTTLGPHIYCCGHVHAAWSYVPLDWPEHLSLNSGAPLLRDPTGLRPPGFLEITLHDDAVATNHHAWLGDDWAIRPMFQDPSFFANEPAPVGSGS